MSEYRSPVRSSSDLQGRDPVDRKHRVHVRPWWEAATLGRLSAWSLTTSAGARSAILNVPAFPAPRR